MSTTAEHELGNNDNRTTAVGFAERVIERAESILFASTTTAPFSRFDVGRQCGLT